MHNWIYYQGITGNVGYKQRRKDVSSSQYGTTTRQQQCNTSQAFNLRQFRSLYLKYNKLIAKFNEAHFSQSAAAVYCATLKKDLVLRFNVYMFKRTIIQLFESSFPSSGCEISVKTHTDKNNIDQNVQRQAKQETADRLNKTWLSVMHCCQ